MNWKSANLKIGILSGAIMLALLPQVSVAQNNAGPAKGSAPRFEKLDADGNGSISFDEFATPMRERFAAADTDGDEMLSQEEIQALRGSRGPGGPGGKGGEGPRFDPEDRAQKMVDRLDQNDDGLLSAEELAAAPARNPMFDRLDADGDGMISAEEFAQAKQAFRQHGPKGQGGYHKGPRPW